MMKLPETLQHDSPEHVVEVLSQAFLKDNFQNYLTRTQLNLKNSTDLTVQHNRDVFSNMVRYLQQIGALLVTAPDAPSVASVWLIETPSQHDEDDDENDSTPKAVRELMALSGPVWRQEFPDGQQVLHLALVGNAGHSNREKGQKGASYVIREMLKVASKEGMPVVLEATSPMSRDIYLRSGFEVVQEVRVGKGHATSGGQLEMEGDGFPMTLMKYCG